jgi:hypothetical protein
MLLQNYSKQKVRKIKYEDIYKAQNLIRIGIEIANWKMRK